MASPSTGFLDPASLASLAHRFYRRQGEILIEYGEEAARIESQAVPGFFVLREWLHPDSHPALADALARIGP